MLQHQLFCNAIQHKQDLPLLITLYNILPVGGAWNLKVLHADKQQLVCASKDTLQKPESCMIPVEDHRGFSLITSCILLTASREIDVRIVTL